MDGDAAGVVAGQRQGDCAAGTRAGTSDECNLAAQVERVVANHVGFLIGCGGLCRSRSRTRACRGSESSSYSVNVEYSKEAKAGVEQGPASFHRRCRGAVHALGHRSEEHTSELQSLMRISYAVFCLKKKKYA